MKILIENVNQIFWRAHNEIIDSLPTINSLPKLNKQLKKAWFDNFNVKIHSKHGTWNYLEFNSEKDYIFWLLKYSR